MKRKYLKKKVREAVDRFGPQIVKDFDRLRLIPGLEKGKKSKDKAPSSASSWVTGYLDVLELNNAFGSLEELGI